MSLPAAFAPLSMSMIITELGYTGSLTNISLSGSETGLYGVINLCSPSHPDGVSPFAISEWYSYDNGAICFLPPPTSSISSSWYWQVNVNNFGTRFPISVLDIKQNWSKQQQIHPTQKPVALMEYLIKTYSNEGDTVLDFVFGSGTVGVACKNLKRNFIGIEKDENYFNIAKNRIESVSEG
jgi:hypothetical protein